MYNAVQDRASYIGSHDSAAILGEHPWRSPMDVYNQKTRLTEEAEPTERMSWGLRLQPVILNQFAEQAGVALEPERFIRHPDMAWFGGSPDATIAGQSAGVDAKNVEFNRKGEWGDPGTDQVPTHVLLQCQHFMALLDYDLWYVAVLFSGSRLVVFTVPRDREIGDQIINESSFFWREHVMKGIPPAIDGSAAARAYIERKYPSPTSAARPATDTEISLIEAIEADKSEEKALGQRREANENRLRASIADAAGILHPGGRVSYASRAGASRINRKALEHDHPDLAARYVVAGAPTRVLSFYPAKPKE